MRSYKPDRDTDDCGNQQAGNHGPHVESRLPWWVYNHDPRSVSGIPGLSLPEPGKAKMASFSRRRTQECPLRGTL